MDTNQMTLPECKEKFVCEWGKLSTNWGVNKAMGHIHGLLLLCPDSLSTDEIMEQLNISRGNVNMNLRSLIEWGIVVKVHKDGERREYFAAEKDMWKVLRAIIAQRKKKELDPMVELLNRISCIEPECSVSSEYCRTINELQAFANKADRVLDSVISSDLNWMTKSFIRMMK